MRTFGDRGHAAGPLAGHHHETYVLPLPGPDGEPGRRVKVREPKSGHLWFDRRCFASEEQLLCALAGRIDRIPGVVEVEGFSLQEFIEGRPLGALHRPGRRVPEALVDQIVGTFGRMAAISPDSVSVDRRCCPEDRPEDGDTAGFLERLIWFAEDRVYVANQPEFGGLFNDLGIDDDVFPRLRKEVSGLSSRPFCLLHGDLHRDNLIIDPQGRLWVIDWELAMFGDPLYDLATHLYLMRYPRDQERRVVERWARAVEWSRPGASGRYEWELNLLLHFKWAQSVFTDVIRKAMGMEGIGSAWRTTLELRPILERGAGPLGLYAVPSPPQIASALLRWQRSRELPEAA